MVSFLSQYPEVMAIAIALIGFVVAGLMANWMQRGLSLLERGIRRLSPQRADQLHAILPAKALGRIVYYATLVFSLLLAIRILGISSLSEWLDIVLGYIPQILLGGFIILVGYLLGILVHGVVANRLHEGETSMLPRLAQGIVVVTFVMTGLEQMQIDISFLTSVIIIILAASVGGVSLAFAIGSRNLVDNILSRRNLTRYHVGDLIRVAEVEGTIIEFTATSVIIETAEGRVNVPASRFMHIEVTLRNR